MEKVEIDIDGKLISLEAGDLARQAGGAVVIRQGDTMVLVTATMAKEAREGIDFFPLTVDYREKNLCCWENSRKFFQARS
jgi:polyribonucleotide nucleotidyltransferase